MRAPAARSTRVTDQFRRPANGVMKVQFASARAHTNYGWDGKFYTGFVDGLKGYDVNMVRVS